VQYTVFLIINGKQHCVINNNNPTPQIINHYKVRMAQVCWWLNLIIELATVSVIPVQNNCKNPNNHTKVMTRKLLAPFL